VPGNTSFSNAVIQVQFGSVSPTQPLVNVSGCATLSGSLQVSFVTAPPASVTVLSAACFEGSFSSVQVTAPAGACYTLQAQQQQQSESNGGGRSNLALLLSRDNSGCGSKSNKNLIIVAIVVGCVGGVMVLVLVLLLVAYWLFKTKRTRRFDWIFLKIEDENDMSFHL